MGFLYGALALSITSAIQYTVEFGRALAQHRTA
jgi:hypothetical protein